MKDSILLANQIRNHVVDMTSRGKSSHVGSALSIVDIVAILYGKILKYDPKNPQKEDRDRFILSKGHAGVAVYAALAESGFFSVDLLLNHYQNGSIFSGHVSHKGIAGVEVSTGSLGHGLGIGVGMAYGAKLKKKSHNVYVLMSDGELDEGSNWESLLFASHHCLENLIILIDYNKLQSLTTTEKTLNLEPLEEKFLSFKFNTLNINGHNHKELNNAFANAISSGKPSVIICNTIKGYGVSFMENSVLWHYRSPQDEEYKMAKRELLNNKNCEK